MTIDLLHQLGQLHSAKLDQLVDSGLDTRSVVLLLSLIKEQIVEDAQLVIGGASAIEESKAEKRVHADLPLLVLEDARFDKLDYSGVILLDLLPGRRDEEFSEGLNCDN